MIYSILFNYTSNLDCIDLINKIVLRLISEVCEHILMSIDSNLKTIIDMF